MYFLILSFVGCGTVFSMEKKCPEYFKLYSKTVEELVDSIEALDDFHILFIDSNGEVYDCASVGYTKGFIDDARAFHKENAKAIKSIAERNESFEMLNLCNVARRELPKVNILEVFLPATDANVDKEWCEKRLLKILNNLGN